MNEQLQAFARAELKAGLAQCTEAQQMFFRRMYAHRDLALSIDDAVEQMPEEKLDWAMEQVRRQIAKNRAALEEKEATT